MIIKGLNRKKQPIKVEIEGRLIKKVSILNEPKEVKKIDQYIIPGFIDIHTHGGYGTDFIDNSEENTRKYLRELAKEGTTSIIHATITTPFQNLLNCIKTAKIVQENLRDDEVRYLGVNIEGNFLNKLKKGSHKEELLISLEKKHVVKMSSFGNLRIISAAYENSDFKVIKYIKSKKIIPSLAHTIATGKEVELFINYGLKGITHIFNAMPTFNHRNDTSTVRALIEDNLYTEIIVDGIHVHPKVIELLYKIKPLNKILVITDSTPLKGMPNGEYKFGELEVYKNNKVVRTKKDNVLAGSVATMHECFKNFIKFTNCSIEEASIVTSTNQATYLNEKNIGDIKEGYFADILILDKDLEIKKTIVNGKVLFKK